MRAHGAVDTATLAHCYCLKGALVASSVDGILIVSPPLRPPIQRLKAVTNSQAWCSRLAQTDDITPHCSLLPC
jgi:hypothetical protein